MKSDNSLFRLLPADVQAKAKEMWTYVVISPLSLEDEAKVEVHIRWGTVGVRGPVGSVMKYRFKLVPE